MRLTIEVNGVPTTVELPDEVVDALTALAARHGLSLEEMTAQAIVNQKRLEDEAKGGELIVRKGDKERHFQFA